MAEHIYRVVLQGIIVECDGIDSLRELVDHFSSKPTMIAPPIVPIKPKLVQRKVQTPCKEGDTRTMLLDSLRKCAPATSAEIIKDSGLAANKVYSGLNYLKSKGTVRRNSDGKYDLVRG